MGRRSAASSTAAHRACRCGSGPAGRRRSSPHRHLAIRQPAQGAGQVKNPLRRLRRQTTGTPIGLLIENIDRAPATTTRSRTVSGPGTPTTPTSRNTAFAIIAAAVARRRARPSCASRPARLRASTLTTRLGVTISGYLSQIGTITLAPVDPRAADDNPFFCPDPARIPELEEYMWKLREGRRFGRRAKSR